MAEQLTRWFPPEVTPCRLGVYELASNRDRAFAYWNGERFGYRTWTSQLSGVSVEAAVADAFAMRKAYTCLPERQCWRGLATDPYGVEGKTE